VDTAVKKENFRRAIHDSIGLTHKLIQGLTYDDIIAVDINIRSMTASGRRAFDRDADMHRTPPRAAWSPGISDAPRTTTPEQSALDFAMVARRITLQSPLAAEQCDFLLAPPATRAMRCCSESSHPRHRRRSGRP
jgi:hypothetical protein